MEEPPNTCPLIDDVITRLPDCDDRDSLIDTLEAIRANCVALREWGNDWKQTAGGYEDDIAGLEKTTSELKEKNRKFNIINHDKDNQISVLEDTIERLRNK